MFLSSHATLTLVAPLATAGRFLTGVLAALLLVRCAAWPSGERAQKTSLWGWALGSVTTILLEGHAIATISARQRPGESEAEWAARAEAARADINQRLLVLVHAGVQAATAVGLLQLLPWKPRTVGALGSIASAINCYFLLPPFPKRPAAKPAALPAAAGGGSKQLELSEAAAGKLVAKVA
jgi:hypothetical protein